MGTVTETMVEHTRGRRRPRSAFGDIKLASLGKLYADVPVDAVTKAMEGLNLQV